MSMSCRPSVPLTTNTDAYAGHGRAPPPPQRPRLSFAEARSAAGGGEWGVLSIFLLRDLLRFFFLWLRRRRRRRLHLRAGAADDDDAPAPLPRKPAGLDPYVLASFPTVRFEEAETSAAAPAECAVCLSEFAAGDAVRLLTVCRHAFHAACIDSWLGAHTTCPVCCSDLEAPRPDEEQPDD